MSYKPKLCCTLNMEAACLKCPWTICTKCWDEYANSSPDDISPVFEVHDNMMQGQCLMGVKGTFGVDFTRADREW